MSQHEDKPNAHSAEYSILSPQWQKIDTLMGGTQSMRRAGRTYMPQFEVESDRNYAFRLATAVLFNQFELTLRSLVGKPFGRPISIGEDVPPDIRELLEDVDQRGNNLTVFAREWFLGGMKRGVHYVMVDFPRVDKEQPRTLADDKGLRPYWVSVPATRVLGKRETFINGERVTTQIRIEETATIEQGFIDVEVPQVRVMDLDVNELGVQQVFVRLFQPEDPEKTEGDWSLVDEWAMDIDRIPIVEFLIETDEDGYPRPPLVDLADLNIRHWQSSSDQNVCLTVARYPILAATGVSTDDNLEVGPKKFLSSSNENAKFYFVEHSGAAIESGAKDLRELEAQMGHYGAQFLVKRSGSQTATEKAIDSAAATSPLQDAVTRFNDSIEQALVVTAKWLRLDQGGSVAVNTDFTSIADPTSLDAVRDARKNGDISREAYLAELVRRGVLSDDFNAEEDAALIDDEKEKAMSLFAATNLDPTQDGDKESDDGQDTAKDKGDLPDA